MPFLSPEPNWEVQRKVSYDSYNFRLSHNNRHLPWAQSTLHSSPPCKTPSPLVPSILHSVPPPGPFRSSPRGRGRRRWPRPRASPDILIALGIHIFYSESTPTINICHVSTVGFFARDEALFLRARGRRPPTGCSACLLNVQYGKTSLTYCLLPRDT